MKPGFREDKTTEAAGLFLQLRGGRMSYMKLIKLLYLLDREALLRWGRPVTFDSYVSMDRGPVLSRTLDLITEGPAPDHPSIWAECISEPGNYEVGIRRPCDPMRLSQIEIDLIHETYGEYGQYSRWDLVDLAHGLPEWQDPKGSAIPISYRDILKAGGKTDAEAAQIVDELEELAMADLLLE
ncbi:MAG: Panacea domain-containing protein [Longimicrobiales bacterium]